MTQETETEKKKRRRVVYGTWAELTGNLYMIIWRMKFNGHNEDAVRMQQILDMVVEQDLTDPEVCKAIHAKHKELDVQKQNFDRELAKLQAERE